jgi:1-acyl-sn-glycerol-3-phosphate acyltransferase
MAAHIPKPVAEVWKPELVRLPKLTRARRFFRAFSHGLLKLVAKLCLKVTVEGMENFPKTGPLLVVINHLGDADAPAVVAPCRFRRMPLARSNCMIFPFSAN